MHSSATNPTEHSRVLPFRRVHNFRDLGGYATEDGHTVRWGTLYRSGHLADINRADRRRLDALGLHTVIDLRSVGEREKQPTKLPLDGPIRRVDLPILDEGNATMERELRARIDAGDYEGFDAAANMAAAYGQFATTFTDEYRAFVRVVLEADGQPVLWHCTAGKDRTGFGAAVLLSLLGVDRETIMQDYLLSQQHAGGHRHLLLLLRVLKGKQAVNVVKPLLSVRAEWLQRSFDTLDATYGGMEGYARDALGLSVADIASLRSTRLD